MNAAIGARCTECQAELASGLLSCPGCARLLHGPELSRLAEAAGVAERAGQMTAALTSWRRATELLPPQSVQFTTIQARMKALSAAIDGRGARPPGVGDGSSDANANPKGSANAKKLAGVGAVGAALLKGKALILALLANGKLLLLGLLKLPTLLSLLVYARWVHGDGVGFGLGIVACIYVHEIGHVAALRRYGIDASAPMFIPGFGALVRMKQYPTDAHEEARTGLAGPLWGLGAACAAAAVGAILSSPIALGVASFSGSLNLFNLIPVWELDGARGLRALSKSERLIVAGVAAAIALALHQWMPAFIALFALPRAFGRDVAKRDTDPSANAKDVGDRGMLLLFVALMVALATIALLPLPALAAK
jgi:Zn-dependent protease